MPDPEDLYQLVDDPPEMGRPVLIQALTGFVDAGAAGRLAREHLPQGFTFEWTDLARSRICIGSGSRPL